MPGHWFFYSAAAVFGALALCVLYFSLVHDRVKNRRRRRCPKCWYDMSGSPGLTCSECGFTARRERNLHKTRRRWRWAVSGFILALLSLASSLTPLVQARGYESIIPTTVLVWIAPYIENAGGTPPIFFTGFGNPPPQPTQPMDYRLAQELRRRIDDGRLWDWQWQLLVNRTHSASPIWSITLHTRSQWPKAKQQRILPEFTIVRQVRWFDRILMLQVLDGNDVPLASVITHRQVKSVSLGRWMEPTFPIQHRSAESSSHLCRVVIYRDNGADNWQRIWSGTIQPKLISHPVAPPRAEREQLSSLHVRIYADFSHVGVTWSRLAMGNELPTIAMRISLVRNDDAIATASVWWGTERVGETSPGALKAVPHHYRIPWNRALPNDAFTEPEKSRWTLHIETDQYLALRDVMSTRYLSGAWDLPLQWNAELNHFDGSLSIEGALAE